MKGLESNPRPALSRFLKAHLRPKGGLYRIGGLELDSLPPSSPQRATPQPDVLILSGDPSAYGPPRKCVRRELLAGSASSSVMIPAITMSGGLRRAFPDHSYIPLQSAPFAASDVGRLPSSRFHNPRLPHGDFDDALRPGSITPRRADHPRLS